MNGTNEDCAVPLAFSPICGLLIGNLVGCTAAIYRQELPYVRWLTNPWTGQHRSAEDIAADPRGLHVWPATVTAAKAPAGEHAAAPAPEQETAHCGIHGPFYSGFCKCPTCDAQERAIAEDSHPIRRNRYGLRDKYPSPPVSRLVGFCHPGVFKEWK